ncbi:MAG: 3-demethylubiquinone-9 3-O-methyltransferase, partial [Alphaproteobacteria bacterium]|nr:3-demethylubiquinone-9 3-O-methyltransferase [Alphaproteobacteria bacterium]
IAVASLHAQQSGLDIRYQATTAEDVAKSEQAFDIVLALEIVEHVADVDLFLRSVTSLVKPGGLLIMSTLNRTAKSYLMAIVGAEYVLRMLPRGTHSWKQFIRPSELAKSVTRCGLNINEIKGLTLDPLKWEWRIHPTDLDVNYLLSAHKPQA